MACWSDICENVKLTKWLLSISSLLYDNFSLLKLSFYTGRNQSNRTYIKSDKIRPKFYQIRPNSANIKNQTKIRQNSTYTICGWSGTNQKSQNLMIIIKNQIKFDLSELWLIWYKSEIAKFEKFGMIFQNFRQYKWEFF